MIGTLSIAAKSMRGALHGDDRSFGGVSTDTRTIRDGELFFALQGPNFDGHDYVGTARENGAAAAVVNVLVDADIAQITVDDAKQALGRFGAAWRSAKDVVVVGVTGSNGKTTLKELIAACLEQKASTLATQGNLNNDIGMPLMLLRITDDHEFVVLEMGANQKGEIAYLVSLAEPDVVVITNAAAAHLEGFGSLDGVAHAKGEILTGTKRPRIAVLNADDAYFDYWKSLVEDVRTYTFGFDAAADVWADEIEASAEQTDFRLHMPEETFAVSLPLVGIHNVHNACAAVAVALALGVDSAQIKAALESVVPVAGRLQPLVGNNDSTLFDDTYNANPLSVVAAAEFLAALPGEGWLVLGDMKELGDDAKTLHHEVGEAVRTCGVDRMFACGELSRLSVAGFGGNGCWFESIDMLIDSVAAEIDAATDSVNVLVKGSRSMRMERVVAALRQSDRSGGEA